MGSFGERTKRTIAAARAKGIPDSETWAQLKGLPDWNQEYERRLQNGASEEGFIKWYDLDLQSIRKTSPAVEVTPRAHPPVYPEVESLQGALATGSRSSAGMFPSPVRTTTPSDSEALVDALGTFDPRFRKPAVVETQMEAPMTEVPRRAKLIPKTKTPIGVSEQLKRTRWEERVPFSPFEATRLAGVLMSVKRLEKAGYGDTQEGKLKKAIDVNTVRKWVEEEKEAQERGKTFGAQVVTGISYLPAWGVELWLTGGLAIAGKKVALKATRKAVAKYMKGRVARVAAERAAGKYVKGKVVGTAAKKALGWAAGAAAREMAMPHRVGTATLKRQIPEMHFGKQGEFVIDVKPEAVYTSILKGWGEVFIEVASETAGGAISGALRKLPLSKHVVKGIEGAWLKLHPDQNAAAFAKKFFTKMGYDGIIGEIGEERLATIMHSIANTNNFGAGKDANMFDRLRAGLTQDVKNFPVELAVLATPMAAQATMAGIYQKVARKDAEKKPYDQHAVIEAAVRLNKGKYSSGTSGTAQKANDIRTLEGFQKKVKKTGETPAEESLPPTPESTGDRAQITEARKKESAKALLPSMEERLQIGAKRGTLKKPWEMSQAEWKQAWESAGSRLHTLTIAKGEAAAETMAAKEEVKRLEHGLVIAAPGIKPAPTKWISLTHKKIIEKAVAEGEKVSSEVLSEYPGLTAPVSKAADTKKREVDPDDMKGLVTRAQAGDGKAINELINRNDSMAKVMSKITKGQMEYDDITVKMFGERMDRREPWEMTQAEWIAIDPAKVGDKVARERHKDAVQNAVALGWHVPSQVLEGYSGVKWADDAIAATTGKEKAPEGKPSEKGVKVKSDFKAFRQGETQQVGELDRAVKAGMAKEKTKSKPLREELLPSKKPGAKEKPGESVYDLMTCSLEQLEQKLGRIELDRKEAGKLYRKAWTAGTAKARKKLKIHYLSLNASAKLRRRRMRKVQAIRKSLDYMRNHRRITPEYKDKLKAWSKEFHVQLEYVGQLGQIDADNLKQLQEFLGQYDLVKRTKKTMKRRESLRQFLKRQKEDGETLTIPDDKIAMLDKITLREITIEDLEEIHAMAKHIVHLGAMKMKLIAGKEARDMQKAITEIVKSVLQRARQPYVEPSKVPTHWERQKSRKEQIQETASALFALGKKVDFITEALDGFEDFGICNTLLFEPIKQAHDAELLLGYEIGQKLKEAFKPLEKDSKDIFQKTYKVDGNLITKEGAMAVYANSLNPDNRHRMIVGNQFTENALDEPDEATKVDEETMTDEDLKISEDIIDNIVASLSPKEIAFVDNVMKIMDGLFPQLKEVSEKLTGIRLDKVPFYWPIYADRELSDRAALLEMESDLFKHVFSKTWVEKGMTIKRKGGSAAVDLKFFRVLANHVQGVIHFNTHALAVRDVQRLITSPGVKAAITHSQGKAIYNQLMPWLKNVANPKRSPVDEIDRLVGRLRRNTTAVMLGLKISVSLKQGGSITQTINRIGLLDTIHGLTEFYKTPREARRFIYERSAFMRFRRVSWDREIRDYFASPEGMAMFQGNKKMQEAFFSMISFVDEITVLPSWLGAYHKQMKLSNQNVEKSVRYADMIVSRTQPTASALYMAAIQRGTNLQKIFVMFYTHFSNVYNEMARTTGALRLSKHYMSLPSELESKAPPVERAGRISFLQAMRAYYWVLVVPGIIGTVISSGFKREKLKPKDLAKGILAYGLAAIPIVGNFLGSLLSGYTYSPSPAFEIGKQIERIGKLKTAKSKVKAGVMATGYATGMPTRQAIIMVEGTLDMIEGKSKDPRRFVYSRYVLDGGKKGKKKTPKLPDLVKKGDWATINKLLAAALVDNNLMKKLSKTNLEAIIRICPYDSSHSIKQNARKLLQKKAKK